LTKEWFSLNKKFKSGNYNVDELEKKSSMLIENLAELTLKGVTQIDNISMDMWKDRLWNLIENIGRLPELPDYNDLEDIF
jgi:hypothetical protein